MPEEPESALHRVVEFQIANALVDRSIDPRTVLITAKHSPELLDAQSGVSRRSNAEAGPDKVNHSCIRSTSKTVRYSPDWVSCPATCSASFG